MKHNDLGNSPLGKATIYQDQYNPDLLFAIARSNNRKHIHVTEQSLPFVGMDIWNGYEFSWLDMNGVPHSRRIQLMIPCNSKFLIESKSLKLYLYSFANSKFASEAEVIADVSKDLTKVVGNKHVNVTLHSLDHDNPIIKGFTGICLDDQNLEFDTYQVQSDYLQFDPNTHKEISETLWSNLLKSNCLVTGHPDWGSVRITYTGRKISSAGLLKYLISFREHQEFHEHCVERIFTDITNILQPEYLCIEARYTRRGGLDINPLRVSGNYQYAEVRLFRQ